MNPPPQRPTTPKKELQIQGPRPSPLKVSKDSVKIKKPPPHPQQFQPPQQHQEPVVIYTISPKVIHASVNEFTSLVQRLTGPSSSPPGYLSPAARLASIEKTSLSSDQKQFPPVNTTTTTAAIDDDFMDSIMEGIDLMGQFPGILSPAPATMPPIPAGFFSPAAEDPQNFNWQGANNINSGFNSFMPSPSSNSALFSAPLVSPSPSSWDLVNNFFSPTSFFYDVGEKPKKMTSLINAAASSSSSSLPHSSTDHQNHYTYEVFLSFRGEDMRSNFTDNLHSLLCDRGIETFIDDEIKRGEEISSALVKAIEESRVSIIVFSQNYASSRWCLDELVKILECRKSKGQEVRVVFYKVDPSDVRHQRGAFGDAFATLDQCKYKDSMDKWKAALMEAADLSGWLFKDGESEANFIRKIVGELSALVVYPSCWQVAAHPDHYTYEVFLSFQGEDTRYNFTDHLHTTLCQRGIKTFRDDNLSRGEDLSQELLKRIEESRVSIVIFSQNYASSRWCLDELVKILECRKFKGQKFIPVFYKVAPSDVRKQTGAFGDAFAKIDQCKYQDSMGKWKAALEEAADSSRWTYEEERYETEFINDIVEELSTRVVNPSCKLPVAEHPIGLESCRQDVNILLHAKENIVLMVGIWGPGGIGKTTIAKDVFNSIRHKFEGSCFLTDFRPRGLAKLQETLLSRILNSTLKVSSVDEGVSFIETKMRHKKILLILDDVSDSSQLEKLVPSPDCFGPGSRILITTRDKRWLIAHEVKVYEVKMLNDRHALELFSLHAFRRKGPPSDYLELAQRAIHYAQGLPLALIVLGSHLFCRSREEWEATLDSYRGEDPHREIRDVLKISYDALGVDLKGYFLDIACFFKGRRVAHVKPILEACYDLKSVIGIAQLQEKALIRIDRDRIWMHDLIEEMGKDIVYQESPGEPGKRSRVWSEEDINHVLTKNTGTNKVIGIQVPWWSSTISLNAKTFSKMKNLGYISMSRMMKYESFSRDIEYLSNQLRWLDWPECPLPCFPSDFHAKKLVNLNISESRGITRLWEGRKNFSWLTCLNLRGCTSLKELPNFTGIPNLKELDLFECTSLVEVPDSIRFLHNLVTLNVRCCSNLIMFPRKINLRSVKTISVSYCKLEEFSEVEEEMSFLTSLDLPGTCIKELHPSISKFIGLEELILGDSQNLTLLPYNIYELRNLKRIDAHNCPKLATFPEIPINMDSLRELDLRGSDIRELDESIGNLTRLQLLDLSDCKNLTTLPCSIYELQNLQDLTLINCSKLVRFPRKTNILNVEGCSLSLPKLQMFDIGGCSLSDCDFLMTLDCWETLEYLGLSDNNFVSLPACFTKFVNLGTLVLDGCKRLREIPELPPNVDPDISGCELLEVRFSTLTNPGAVIKAESPSIEDACYFLYSVLKRLIEETPRSFDELEFVIPGSEIPEWFNNQSVGDRVTEKLPSDACNSKWVGVAVCALIVPQDNPSAVLEESPSLNPDNYQIWCDWNNKGLAFPVKQFVSDHLTLLVLPSHDWPEDRRNEVTFSFKGITRPVGSNRCIKVKKCGVRLLYEHDMEELISKMNQSKSSISLYQGVDEQEGAMVKAIQDAATSGSGGSDDEYYSAEE